MEQDHFRKIKTNIAKGFDSNQNNNVKANSPVFDSHTNLSIKDI